MESGDLTLYRDRDRARYYDAIYHWKDYVGEAKRLKRLLLDQGIDKGSRVLEAACGTGSYLEQLKEDFEVEGFDLHTGVLGVARAKLPDVHLFEADMAGFKVEEPYDAILCLFSSIGYLYPEDRLRSAVQSFARAIRPGGLVVVEPWLTSEQFQAGRLNMQTYDGEDLKLCRSVISRIEGELSVLDFHWLVLEDGMSDVCHFKERHTLWMCPTRTMLALFDEAGFETRIESGPGKIISDRGVIVGRRR